MFLSAGAAATLSSHPISRRPDGDGSRLTKPSDLPGETSLVNFRGLVNSRARNRIACSYKAWRRLEIMAIKMCFDPVGWWPGGWFHPDAQVFCPE